MVACGWTPTAVPASSAEAASATGGTAPDFLAAIAGELESRGLLVREFRREGILAEIAAFSPMHPERGSVSIGYDGFMIWERWALAANSDRAPRIVRLIAWVLMGETAQAPGRQG
jgi:hypothetical protein